MIEKLQQLEQEFYELENKMGDPEIIADQTEYTKVGRRYKELSPIIELFKEYKQLLNEKNESEEMLETEKDAEMRDLAKEQLENAKVKIPDLEEKLKVE
ncbi:PCRF domain-containing protein, partial [Candidatus Peregrinibacteria bacterium]|nr:PCRF domain-containing protein [Candidatus Peregrinibacteria bacterium]